MNLFNKNYPVRALLNLLAYLYGRGAVEKITGRLEVEYNKWGRMKNVYIDGKLAFVLRNNDGYLLPTAHGAVYMTRRVVISSEVVEYIRGGRNVPAKYVIDITPEARPNGEVAVVNPSGELVAVGRLIYSARELTLGRGYAVKVRAVSSGEPPPES